ncbi:helix-turn-helix transcriptional regulator [Pseudoalteromonas luteoviolacea]|uniref:helix-turn-helix domain-containing protein n=1 Tax=Pseudoalteromonas luteoviolacea TaxID=43657 RepID=UPI001B38F58D|nr:helix-turn-helix transcriptional regulator [Pseudoalteromonas luteoviolacea]MBQ4875731.1 helix-turn-helix transcriptional regulator [Pseudoalteromonas luteoviolacea]MBQ4904766.1 helix-turn-helix transcriptional regulator [Pseudoalteromonas luteoviolacea]
MDEIDPFKFGEKLRHFVRKELIAKQGSVSKGCKKAGVSRSTMNNYLNGTSEFPQSVLTKLHNGCKIDVYGFLASMAGVAGKYNNACIEKKPELEASDEKHENKTQTPDQ